MDSEDPDSVTSDGEGPVRDVTVAGFAIDPCVVSNDDFAQFIESTGYHTEAEAFGWSFVFAAFLPGHRRAASPRPDAAPWWCGVRGASWQEPEGPGSDTSQRGDHPVVHVSHHDALAYAAWAGGRLPTEAEWEFAARGGLRRATFAWGDDLMAGGEHRCNIWQGTFPTTRNTGDDGFLGTCPVDAFPANGFGLYNVAGNVWEWCADSWTTEHQLGPSRNARRPGQDSARGHPRRLVPVPRVVLHPLPRRCSHQQHP